VTHRQNSTRKLMRLTHSNAFVLAFVLALSRSNFCRATRPLLFAPLATPLVNPRFVLDWQPTTWTYAPPPDASPEDYDEYDDRENRRHHHDVDDSFALSDIAHHLDASALSDWRRWYAADASIQFVPVTGEITTKREGWTGRSFETAATIDVVASR